jgi:cell pole-organizing protein PopZ
MRGRDSQPMPVRRDDLMSAASPKPQEPSMEEILASIRRIISDDESRVAAERSRSTDAESEDPFGSVATFPRPAASASGFDDELSTGDHAQPDHRFGTDEPEDLPDFGRHIPERPPSRLEQDGPDRPEPLVSRSTDASVGQAFDLLAQTVVSGTPRPIEDVVREMLRPMLRMWLDDNLPTIVERLVRAEIERVARGGR